jgi:hypothetical protein
LGPPEPFCSRPLSPFVEGEGRIPRVFLFNARGVLRGVSVPRMLHPGAIVSDARVFVATRAQTRKWSWEPGDCPCEVCLLLCRASVSAHKVNTKAQVLKNSHILCGHQFEHFFGHRLRIEHSSLKGKRHKDPKNDFSPLIR